MDNDQVVNHQQKIEPPTPLSRRFIRYLLGFGVAIAVGLAPYLGNLNVPLFTPLLKLIPMSVRDTLIPLSAALMGVVAVVVQWYGGEHLSRAWLRRNFKMALIVNVSLLLLLLLVHTLVVVRVPIRGGKDAVYFLVGLLSRPNSPPCAAEVADGECIKRLTFDTARIESFWGSRSVRLSQMVLSIAYLGSTSAFAFLVGLVLLRDEYNRKSEHHRRDAGTTKAKVA